MRRINKKIAIVVAAIAIVTVLAFLGPFKFTIWSHRESTTIRTLDLSEIIFCSEDPGSDNYIAQPDNTYNAGDNVYMYIESPAFSYREPDIGYEIHLTLSMKLLKDENVLGDWPDFLEYKSTGSLADLFSTLVTESIDEASVWFTPQIETSHDFSAGKYDVEITVTDHISSQTKTVSGSFHIE